MGLPNKQPPIRINLPKLKPAQEATVIDLGHETDARASWPTGERLRAWHRIIPRAHVKAGLAQTGHDRAVCPRLPGWFRGGYHCLGSVLSGWLPPTLPLAATLSPRRRARTLAARRGAPAVGKRSAAQAGRARHLPAGPAQQARSVLPWDAYDGLGRLGPGSGRYPGQ